MKIHTYIPSPPLSQFIEAFWHLEGADSPYLKERCLPTGTVELVINLRDDNLRIYDRSQYDCFTTYSRLMICGPHSKFFVIDSTPNDSVIGVHFKPGGAFPFFKLPAAELRNAHVPLDTVWGTTAGQLREQLLEAKTLHSRFHILEQALLKQKARSPVRHPAVGFALQEFQAMPHVQTLRDMVDQIGVSHKRFIYHFEREVGLTPKTYCRIRRFQEVLRAVEKQQRVGWAAVALDCGYYDQAHFIHDFRAFSGLNPTSYLNNPGDRLNHVPLSD